MHLCHTDRMGADRELLAVSSKPKPCWHTFRGWNRKEKNAYGRCGDTDGQRQQVEIHSVATG